MLKNALSASQFCCAALCGMGEVLRLCATQHSTAASLADQAAAWVPTVHVPTTMSWLGLTCMLLTGFLQYGHLVGILLDSRLMVCAWPLEYYSL